MAEAMAETWLQDFLQYVEFGPGDGAALRALHPVASPRFAEIAEQFYARVLADEGTRRVLRDESQVGHLKVTLVAWMDRLLSGPWDEAYFEARCRIGRVHVQVGLGQHYMLAAMNLLRRGFEEVADGAYSDRPRELMAARQALGKVLDLDLAIMLHTYREDLLAQQARSERLSTLGQLAASIGHDLRNPLSVIESSAYLLKNRMGNDERGQGHLDRIREQVQISTGIINHVLDMIRDRPLSRERVELGRLIAAAAESVTRPAQVRIALDGFAPLPMVEADPVQIRQVFANLIENAVYAVSPKGQVWVRGTEDHGAILVTVEDDGAGVDPAILQRLFEPLVTTKPKGSGLGLALVKRIAERHGGGVSYQSRTEGGARFTVRLPL